MPPAGGISCISCSKPGFVASGGPWLTGQGNGEILVTVLSRMELPLPRSVEGDHRAEILEYPVASARVVLTRHEVEGDEVPGGIQSAVTGPDGKVSFILSDSGPRREMTLILEPEMERAIECFSIARELARKGFAVQKDVIDFFKRNFADTCSAPEKLSESEISDRNSVLNGMSRFLKALERGADVAASASSTYMQRWKPVARLGGQLSPLFSHGMKFPGSPAWRNAPRKDLLSIAVGRYSRTAMILLNDITRLLSANEKMDLWSRRPEGFALFPAAAEAFVDLRDIILGRTDGQMVSKIYSTRVFEAYKILAERSFNRFMSDLRKGGTIVPWEPPAALVSPRLEKSFEKMGKPAIDDPGEARWPRDPFSSDGARFWQTMAASLETAAVQATEASSGTDSNPFLWPLRLLGKFEPAGDLELRKDEEPHGERPYQELKSTIIQYSKFGIYRKLEREIIDRIESFKTYLERLSGLITQGRTDDAMGQIFLFHVIAEEFSMVKETLLAFSLADDSLFTENIAQSVSMTTKSLLSVQAGQLEVLREFITLATSGSDSECLSRIQTTVGTLAEGLRRLSLNVVETFAKIHLEEVSFPGLLVISRMSGANQSCEALSEIELKYRVWNIGLEGISDLTISLEADLETKIFEPSRVMIKTLGVDEEKVVSFRIRPGAAPKEGIVVLRCVYGLGFRESPGPLDFLIVPERVPPKIEFVLPGEAKQADSSEPAGGVRKISAAFEDQTGIDTATLKVIANGDPVALADSYIVNREEAGNPTLEIPFTCFQYGEVRLTVEATDFSGNIAKKSLSFSVERPKWPYFAVFFSLLGIFAFTLLACYFGGNWKCPSCGSDNKWWTLVCGSCKAPRPAFLLKHMALSALNFLRDGVLFLYDRICWLVASARGRVRLVFLKKRFEESLFDLGTIALSEKTWLESAGSQQIRDRLQQFSTAAEKITSLEERISSLRKKVETGELYGAKGESLWDIALEIQLAGEEIEKHRRYSRRVILEIGEWVYRVAKGGSPVSTAISHATRLTFHIEAMFYKIGEEPEFHFTGHDQFAEKFGEVKPASNETRGSDESLPSEPVLQPDDEVPGPDDSAIGGGPAS